VFTHTSTTKAKAYMPRKQPKAELRIRTVIMAMWLHLYFAFGKSHVRFLNRSPAI